MTCKMQAPSIKCQQNQIICNNAKQLHPGLVRLLRPWARKRSRPYSYSHGAHMGQTLQNSMVFKCAQNWVTINDESRNVRGNELHSVWLETAKLLGPYLVIVVQGTTTVPWLPVSGLNLSKHVPTYCGLLSFLYEFIRWTVFNSLSVQLL